MSIILDDCARDEIITRNGKQVVIDTRYVPYPLGHGYETQVFAQFTNQIGHMVTDYGKGVLDEKRYGESKTAAETGHTKMVNKWIKEILV